MPPLRCAKEPAAVPYAGINRIRFEGLISGRVAKAEIKMIPDAANSNGGPTFFLYDLGREKPAVAINVPRRQVVRHS